MLFEGLAPSSALFELLVAQRLGAFGHAQKVVYRHQYRFALALFNTEDEANAAVDGFGVEGWTVSLEVRKGREEGSGEATKGEGEVRRREERGEVRRRDERGEVRRREERGEVRRREERER